MRITTKLLHILEGRHLDGDDTGGYHDNPGTWADVEARPPDSRTLRTPVYWEGLDREVRDEGERLLEWITE